jgi:hypothetical protein
VAICPWTTIYSGDMGRFEIYFLSNKGRKWSSSKILLVEVIIFHKGRSFHPVLRFQEKKD